MRYEHTPRPDIEHHHHIRDLMEAQEKSSSDRETHRARQAILDERGKEIASTKRREILPFWCKKCKKDFVAETIREDERDWGDQTQTISFYRTKCPAGHWCIRLAIDKGFDPYWSLSRKACKDRGEHALDIVQPHETGYNLLYGHKARNQEVRKGPESG